MRYVDTRASEASPLCSVPMFRPASAVPALAKAQWTALDQANCDLAIAQRDLPGCERSYAYTREVLGNANRRRGPMRRYWQGQAFRALNAARAALRRVRKALAAAQLAVLMATSTGSAV
jgi:hypothetical protein